MPELGRKYTCYSCHTKFYDLGKPIPTCPKCGADQRDAEEAPIVPTRGRASRAAPVVVIEEPAEDNDFGPEAETPAVADTEEDEEVVGGAVAVDDREEEAEEEEEEY